MEIKVGRVDLVGANTHHVVWSSIDTKPRGEYHIEFIFYTNISIFDDGTAPSFVTIALRSK